MLADRTDHALHSGPHRGRHGLEGLVAASASMGVLLQDGIGDTDLLFAAPEPAATARWRSRPARSCCKTMGFRSFTPAGRRLPRLRRTTSNRFFRSWRRTSRLAVHLHAGMEDTLPRRRGALNVAVMGCIVNGPGESKHADIGISLCPVQARRPRAPASSTARRPRRSRAPGLPPNSSRWVSTISNSGSAACGLRPDGVELGLGLLSIGRVWASPERKCQRHRGECTPRNPRSRAASRIFDTAPAYAASERRLGAFLRTLRPPFRDRLVVMTKMWRALDEAAGAPYVDHGRDALNSQHRPQPEPSCPDRCSASAALQGDRGCGRPSRCRRRAGLCSQLRHIAALRRQRQFAGGGATGAHDSALQLPAISR